MGFSRRRPRRSAAAALRLSTGKRFSFFVRRPGEIPLPGTLRRPCYLKRARARRKWTIVTGREGVIGTTSSLTIKHGVRTNGRESPGNAFIVFGRLSYAVCAVVLRSPV